ncbi:hypothetical protein LTR62_008018 [Meristemomyces frigidus]|uniref:PH domain-containing protein n=1 Tax=Meristemomyces frigidus TaxID=1508187 RepID=A0AAN7TGZ4_9PEZI|nr:hypothetical protein LTR62_008018 [Meristemomyces frigidus]
MSEPAANPTHKRTRSAVTRALQRISSRGDVPTLSTQPENESEMAAPSPVDDGRRASNGDLLSPTAPRASMQSARPHLSTTMSNVGSSRKSLELRTAVDPAELTPSSATQGTSIEQSVRLFKVFESLRNGDTAAIARACKPDADSKLEGTTVLHLSIQCAEQAVIEYVLSQQSSDVNARDRDGNTPLHIASMLGRASVVKLLLADKQLNDSMTNYQGKSPLDVARTPEIFQELQLARSINIDANVRRIQQLVTSSDYEGLESALADSHVRSVLDVNGPELATDPATTEHGGTLLHEAARKKDIKLAQLLLLNGADPFKRDRKGKLPQDVTKDERTRAILKRSPAAQTAQRNIQERTVLGDNSQVGVAASPADAGPGGKEAREMKGYLRKWTNYTSGYKLRWFVLEDGVLSYYKHQDDAGSACRGAINMRIGKLHMDPKDKLQFEIHGKSSVKYSLKANHEIEAKRWYWALNNAIQWAKDEAKEEQRRQQQQHAALREARHEQLERQKTREGDVAQSGSKSVPGTALDLPSSASMPVLGSSIRDEASMQDNDSVHGVSNLGTTIAGDVDDDEEYADDASSHDLKPANKDAFSITAQSAKLQLDLLEQVNAAVKRETKEHPDLPVSHPTIRQAAASYDVAVGNLKGLLGDLLRISRDHESYWQYRVEREQNIRRLWEDSMARVAAEQDVLESRIGESEEKRKRTKRALKDALASSDGRASNPLSPDVDPTHINMPILELPEDNFRARSRRPTLAQLTNNEVSDDEGEDEEEFFDAVDAGEVEVVDTMPPSSPSPPLSEEKNMSLGAVLDNKVDPEQVNKEIDIAKSYRGYEDGIRKRLKLDADNRPRVGLWSILKSMIGKDMTKMTLPVSFNEPTSLLYRVVEDMEYTELLNVAADRMDSTERLVYVAGFAASEYASTIGRVAKPFNPLLGETYEYVRPDLGYRFFIEQVSHHPPVGAAYAESQKWDYYGESAVKSKFYGKSFEFNPLGTWFLHLRPASGGEELYTWKKVTSSVVGIITGNPVVDNYGPMEVKNWTTGEVCYLDFKPKGWKASSAFQVTGRVVDKGGRTRWSIGGRWNDKIYARFTPGYEASVEPPTHEKSGKDQAFLIWEAHARPTGIPFNLTPFAVTLNAIPDRLRPLVAPTDTRLRPDQRAMEEGEYEFAAVEKNRVEEGQRARRKQREAQGEEFVPRWFRKSRHPITGEEYWDFGHDYWKVRDEVADGKRRWEELGLEPIYQ